MSTPTTPNSTPNTPTATVTTTYAAPALGAPVIVKPRKKKRRWGLWLGLGLLALILFAVVGKRMGWLGQEETLKVATEKPERRTILEKVLANGKVAAETEVKISSEVSGEILQITVAPGDSVRKGQLLVRVNPDVLQSNLDRSTAALNNAIASLGQTRARLAQQQATFSQVEANFSRQSKLYRDKVIAAAEFEQGQSQYLAAKQEIEAARLTIDAARYNVESAQAVVSETRKQLTRTTLYAPITGIVTRVNSKVGETVVGTSQMAGTEIMTLADLTRMEVSVEVSENDIVRIRKGDTAEVEIDAFPGRTFMGRVREVANATTLAAGAAALSADQVANYAVKISIDEAGYADIRRSNPRPFLPGMSATVAVRTATAANVLSVPIAAVTTRDADAFMKDKKGSKDSTKTASPTTDNATNDASGPTEAVFVLDGGKVKLLPVTTGLQDDKYFQISTGLTGNEEVVIAPFSAISKDLKDGKAATKVAKDKLFEDGKEE